MNVFKKNDWLGMFCSLHLQKQGIRTQQEQWTGSPGMLQYMRSQRVRHNWATELNWRASG